MTGPFYSVLFSKCPRCNVGDLYEDNNPYHLSKLGKMHRACPCCGQLYEPETGFYYGAMYVSYGLSILVMFGVAAVLYFGFDADFKVLLFTILGIYIALFPVFFRFARNIWLSMFVRFDQELHERALAKKR